MRFFAAPPFIYSKRDSDTPETASKGKDSHPEPPVDEITDSLTDEGFDIFHGREYISFRTDSHLAPNPTVVEQHLEGKEAVSLAYNEDSNEVALIPLSADYDRGDVYSLKRSDGSTVIAATGFFKEHDLSVDQTVRYSPEWDGDIGGNNVPGGLVIDLDEDGEVYAAASPSGSTDES